MDVVSALQAREWVEPGSMHSKSQICEFRAFGRSCAIVGQVHDDVDNESQGGRGSRLLPFMLVIDPAPAGDVLAWTARGVTRFVEAAAMVRSDSPGSMEDLQDDAEPMPRETTLLEAGQLLKKNWGGGPAVGER